MIASQELRSSKAHVQELERAREAGEKQRQEDRAVRNQLNQVHANNLAVARQYEKVSLGAPYLIALCCSNSLPQV